MSSSCDRHGALTRTYGNFCGKHVSSFPACHICSNAFTLLSPLNTKYRQWDNIYHIEYAILLYMTTLTMKNFCIHFKYCLLELLYIYNLSQEKSLPTYLSFFVALKSA